MAKNALISGFYFDILSLFFPQIFTLVKNYIKIQILLNQEETLTSVGDIKEQCYVKTRSHKSGSVPKDSENLQTN